DLSNPWWRDVLEKGSASLYATWFDIDWDHAGNGAQEAVLLPVLEDHYAKVLESGKLRLDLENGKLAIGYYDRKFPLSPESQTGIIEQVLSTNQRSSEPKDSEEGLATMVNVINGRPGEPRSFDRLDALLRQQHYRLVHWRAGPDEINYRR